MKILAISSQTPSLKVTNDDILRWIDEYSPNTSRATVAIYQRLVRGLFKQTGSSTRFIVDRSRKETAFQFIKKAMEESLVKAGCSARDIDLLIYCGVGKGFKEPANAYFYAKAMKMECGCFDIADACMSWVRALEIAYGYLKLGTYRRIMILNGEFNAHDHGFPELFEVKSLAQLSYTFPTYTIGEAATATVVGPSDDVWSFHYKSVPKLCDLCTIPLEGYEGYVEKSSKHNLNGVHKFVSYGKELFDNAEKYLAPLVVKHVANLLEPVLYFPHAASSTAYLSAAKKLHIPAEKVFTGVFPLYGNLVSASIPTGIVMAEESGRIHRGDRLVLIPASAGMSHAVVQFNY